MPYCPKCGIPLPEDKEARFCPNCGIPLAPRAGYRKTELVEVKAFKERKAGTLSSRIIVLAIVIALSFMMTSFGALSKVEPLEARDILQEMDKLRYALAYAGVAMIFGNNLMHCLIMFIPILGPFYGFYVLYSIGRALAAIGSTAGVNPLLLFVNLFAFPFAWMEYISYGIAISESLWLVYMAVRHRFGGFKNEWNNASKAIAICAVLLLLAAFSEMLLIQS